VTTIVNAALTGMVPQKRDNPHVPITPAEVGRDAERAVARGASIVHLHARDDDGRPAWRRDRYAEVIAEVRSRCPDVIVCVSTSGRLFGELEQRADVLDLDGDVKPELASLTLGSLNFPTQASVNEPSTIRALAARMHDRGIMPELEVFDLGMLDYARYLIEHDVLRPPFYVNILLGSLGTLAATPRNLIACVEALPDDATWAATGIGRFQFSINCLALALGGGVRVGLEDNLWLDDARSELATNELLVERVATIAAAMGRCTANPDEARRLIGLPLLSAAA
jgi:uncharacterized protein (DUF849 family)